VGDPGSESGVWLDDPTGSADDPADGGLDILSCSTGRLAYRCLGSSFNLPDVTWWSTISSSLIICSSISS
jgi:hypothetical protein